MIWEELETVYEIHGTNMYDWLLVSVLFSPEQGVFFGYIDGGCSCNFPYEEGPSTGPMSRKEAIEWVHHNRFSDGYYDIRAEDFNDMASAVRKWNMED